MATIDPTIIKKLVETQLQTVAGTVIPAASIFFAGDVVPDGLTRWVKIVAIDVSSGERPRSASYSGATQDEPDHADIVVTINAACSAGQMRGNSGSLSSVLAAVRKVMGQATMIDASTNHQVDLMDCRTIVDVEPDEQRRLATGAVVIEGTATRTAGSTMAEFV